jgi:plasmid stabilization system protein ParE
MVRNEASHPQPVWPLTSSSHPRLKATSQRPTNWYESRRVGLGEDLLSSIEATLEGIRRRPDIHSIAYEGYRRALLRRFPYAIIYRWANGRVTVYAVFHTSRDPLKWRARRPLHLNLKPGGVEDPRDGGVGTSCATSGIPARTPLR